MKALAQETNFHSAHKEIAERISELESVDRGKVFRIAKEVCGRYNLPKLPKSSEILSLLPSDRRKVLSDVLRTKPTQTASGVAVVGVMTKPFPCPHGVCIFCPGGEKFGTPQSYTPGEPATLKAARVNFDPIGQIRSRLDHLSSSGHNVEKVEIIVLGGTFLSVPLEYQRNFIKACYDALNGFNSPDLEKAKETNERAQHRVVGLTIETKPDWCSEKDVDLMLEYGATRVEIGVQALDDDVLKLSNRGHGVKETVSAFQVARDAGYKIGAHMMLGLPGSNPEKDLEYFRRLFTDPSFMPDMLKVYPTLLIESTGLSRLYERGLYKPYDVETAIKVVAEVKKMVPKWVRIMRVQREIPAHEVKDGVKKSNLRELALEELRREGYTCHCIRCREIGLKTEKERISLQSSSLRLFREDYEASAGKEVFISFEDEDQRTLVGFLRLRFPSQRAHRAEIRSEPCCIVRELHVFGRAIAIGEKVEGEWQHKGIGRRLMAEAERIALEEFGVRRVIVISGVGTKEYYRRLGYHGEGPYMAKRLVGGL